MMRMNDPMTYDYDVDRMKPRLQIGECYEYITASLATENFDF